MRAVECWTCGRLVQAAGDDELARRLADHLRAEHGDAEPDPVAIRRWIERQGRDPAVGLGVLTVGRVLAGAAAVTFVLLALMNPGGLGGVERTMQLMGYLAFAALAGAVVCALTLLGRLLRR